MYIHIMNEYYKYNIIKIFGIGYSIILYFIYVILSIRLLNYIFNYDNISKLSLYKSIILFLLRLWFISILFYIARNYLIYIHFPFDKYYGYDHTKLKEINSGIFTLSLFGLFDANLRLLANNIIVYI